MIMQGQPNPEAAPVIDQACAKSNLNAAARHQKNQQPAPALHSRLGNPGSTEESRLTKQALKTPGVLPSFPALEFCWPIYIGGLT
jgi:hypothetical protein